MRRHQTLVSGLLTAACCLAAKSKRRSRLLCSEEALALLAQVALADADLLSHLRGSGGLGTQLAALRGLFLLGAPAAADFATGLFTLLDAGQLPLRLLIRMSVCQCSSAGMQSKR